MIGWVACILFTSLALHWDTADNHRFENICEYSGGRVADDLCVKGATVIGKNDSGDWVVVK
jgi:hypothetical protein